MILKSINEQVAEREMFSDWPHFHLKFQM